MTGSGRRLAGAVLGIPTVNEIVAQAVAAARFCPGARTIIEIGGQDSKYIRLDPSAGPAEPVILSQEMNDICAAGTGAFIEQQAERLGIPIEEFGDLAAQSTEPAYVAGRCAVFAKTDIVHLKQEGEDESDIAAGICRAIVRSYIAQFLKGRRIEPPVVFQGGVAANAGVVKAFREMLDLDEDEFVVPPDFLITGAIGAAIEACKHDRAEPATLDELFRRTKPSGRDRETGDGSRTPLPPLESGVIRIPVFAESAPADGEDAYVGIDVGSTSTCVAVLGTDDRLLAHSYVLNEGSVLDAVDAALGRVAAAPGIASIRIRGAGVTGSGRHLVSAYVGADLVQDEITAQARAAVRMLPGVDTVFEIGGQDSKYIRIRDGRVVDFEMNKVCAAGTGAFIQEQAAKMGEKLEAMSAAACAASSPMDVGSRCTVFMESDIVSLQQRGVGREDLIAGVSYSIARNFLEKVVGGRTIGENILFLGGVAFNDSVVSAFRTILGRDLVVPQRHEISAAIGAALLAREQTSGAEASRFRGFAASRERWEISAFRCTACANMCRIRKIEHPDGSFFHGGICGKYEEKAEQKTDLPDLFKERAKLLLSYHAPASAGAERIGIPRVHLYHEMFPLWCTFLQELGFEVVVSDPTNREIVDGGLECTAIDNCFACKVGYGHVRNLLGKGVRRIFLPAVVEFERRVQDLEHNYTCPHVQALPSLLAASFDAEFISPSLVRDAGETQWHRTLQSTALELGAPAARARAAVEQAIRAHADFTERRQRLGESVLADPDDSRLLVVVMGKTYNVCDPELNLHIADKLRRKGVVPIPFDCLPLSDQELPAGYRDLVWEAGQDLVRTAKIVTGTPRLHALLITNFGCGPDSFIVKYLEELFREKSVLTLEVDEHTSDVGVMTRIEAFLNSARRADPTDFDAASSVFHPFVPSPRLHRFDGTLYVSQASPSFRVLGTAFEAAGMRTRLLPPHDEETMRLGTAHTSGRECLPYIMYLGDAIRMTHDPEFHPDRAAFLLPGSNLACRVSLYPTATRLVLRKLGYPQVEVIAPRVSMDTDETLGFFGVTFARNIFRSLLVAESFTKMRLETRPYERVRGETDRVYEECMNRLCRALGRGGYWKTVRECAGRFDAIPVDRSEQRPVVGLIGDEYTRSNSFANNGFVEHIESLGAEVWDAPMWCNYLEFQRVMKPRKMLSRGRYAELVLDLVKSFVEKREKRRLDAFFTERLRYHPNPTFSQMMGWATQRLDEHTEPLTIIALAHVMHLIRLGVHGIAHLGAFQCMISSVISAHLREMRREHGNIPVLTLNFDSQRRVHQENRIEAFMYQVRQRRR